MPAGGSGGPDPAEAEGPPPIDGSVCAQLGSADSTGDGSGLTDDCPKATGDAILVEWHPAIVVRRMARSSVFFHVKNLLHEEVTVEYQATVAMNGGGEAFNVPLLNRGIQTHTSRGGGPIQADLALAQTLGVLQEGEVEILVSARLLAPVQTPMIQMARAVVQTKLDEDGYIYDIDYVDW